MEKDLKHTLAALLLAASTCLTQAATPMSGFAGNPEVVDFARDLEQREGFNAEQSWSLLTKTLSESTVLKQPQNQSKP